MVMTMIFLQDTTAVSGAHAELPFYQVVLKGGWILVPIVILFFMAIYFFFERLLTVIKASKIDRNFMNQVQDLVQDGNIAGARSLCKNSDFPVARMLDKALKKIGRPIDDIEKALESAGKIEVYKLEKNLSILGTIAGVAPMLGFIGTILGVITIFVHIAAKNTIDIGTISEGLYQKLISSAAGLVVGIVAHLGYHYLLLRIDREIFKMESTAIEFIDLLQDPAA
jgi:biopolymer transport protein ExbB